MSKTKFNQPSIVSQVFPVYIFGDSEMGLQKLLNDGYKGKIKLIYLDPPYFSGSDFNLTQENESSTSKAKSSIKRGFEISKDLLSEDGYLILHSNFRHSITYLTQLREIFGDNNLLNEIIWQYKRPAYRISKLVNCHENIYVFSKSNLYKVNTKEEDVKSLTIGDVWNDIDSFKLTDKDFDVFPSAKPTKLTSRLLSLFSNEGDIVVDAFTGSGSFLISAKNLQRKAIGIDNSLDSFIITRKRFEQMSVKLNYFRIEDIPDELEKKETEGEENELLENDRKDFNIVGGHSLSTSTTIKEELVKSPMAGINNALEIPLDLFKKLTIFIAFTFPIYLLINLISNNFYWLLSAFTVYTVICLLFAKFISKITKEKALFGWKAVVILISLNFLLALAAFQTVKQKELIKSFKEIIK